MYNNIHYSIIKKNYDNIKKGRKLSHLKNDEINYQIYNQYSTIENM